MQGWSKTRHIYFVTSLLLGTSSSDFAKSESYSILTLPALNRWIANKRPRSNTVDQTLCPGYCSENTVYRNTVARYCRKHCTQHCSRPCMVRSGAFIRDPTVQNRQSQGTIALWLCKSKVRGAGSILAFQQAEFIVRPLHRICSGRRCPWSRPGTWVMAHSSSSVAVRDGRWQTGQHRPLCAIWWGPRATVIKTRTG
jgi:hypothetical protein